MARVVSTTRIDKDLLQKTRAFAHANGYRGANDIMEKALELYFQLQGNLNCGCEPDDILTSINTSSQNKKVQVYEKELSNSKYQIVTIGNGNTCLDYVDKRVLIDTVSDIDHLITDGYYLAFEV